MNTSTTAETAASPEARSQQLLAELRTVLADPVLIYDLNRLGHDHNGLDIIDQIDSQYLDRPDLIAEILQAFKKMRETIAAQDVRSTTTIDSICKQQVRTALGKIGFGQRH